MISRAFESSGSDKSFFLDKVVQVASGRRARCAGDADVVVGTHTAFESVGFFAEHPDQRLFLPFVYLVAESIKKLRLVDQPINQFLSVSLRVQHGPGKIEQPPRDLVGLVIGLQRIVVELSAAVDGLGKRDQGRMTEGFGERLFSDGTSNPAIAVLEWVNADEIQVRNSRTGKRRQRVFSAGCRGSKPVEKPIHFLR